MITITTSLNMSPGGIPPVIHLSQYDSDFSLVFNLYASVGTFTLETGTTAEIRGTKLDGNGYSASATIDITNKRVTVTGNVQMTAIAGRNVFELVLSKSGKVLSTVNFVLDVERAAMDADTVPSESVIREIGEATSDYLDAHPELVYQVDDTLSITGAAADAKKTGDEIANLKSDLTEIEEIIEDLEPGLSDEAKSALLNCFAHVAWTDEHGQDYYDALEEALYAEIYPRISAVYTPGTHVVYTDDTLDSLKPYIVVKYIESAEDAGTVIPSASYSLTGTLTEGTSVITAIYQSYHTAITIANVVDFYIIHEWSISNGLLRVLPGTTINDDHGASINEDATNRRVVGTYRGVLPYWLQDSVAWSDIYPIPIPLSAKKCVISITPSDLTISRGYRIFNGTQYDRTFGWVNYAQGPITVTLPEMTEQYYLQIVAGFVGSGSVFPEEITEFTITFSDTE